MSVTLGLPQLIWLVLMLFSVLKAILHFGEMKKPDHYDWSDVLVGPALAAALLWWGGFFGH